MSQRVQPGDDNPGLSRPSWPFKKYVANLPPEYFAMVMATGIVSIAMHNDGWITGGKILLWTNVIVFMALWILTLGRLVFYRARFIDDLTHHFRSAAFLTVVAGTCVIGCQFAVLTPWIFAAKALWIAGIILWIFLNYSFFTVVTVRNPKPTLQAGINGVWLLTVVSTESVCVLGALIAPFSKRTELVLFSSLAFCLAGAAFYAFFITLILYRWMFFRMKPAKLTPDYWIDMGALAIVTLSLALLLSVSSRWDVLVQLGPFLKGLMLLFWATATWWIPFLCIVETWRHTYGKVPFSYSPDYWSLVFPLGMYSVATDTVAKAAGLVFLHPLATVFSALAVLSWAIVFLGLICHLIRKN